MKKQEEKQFCFTREELVCLLQRHCELAVKEQQRNLDPRFWRGVSKACETALGWVEAVYK